MSMKAKEAAEFVLQQKKVPSVEEVEKLIPEYSNSLPRRSWIVKFLSLLPEDIAVRFADL